MIFEISVRLEIGRKFETCLKSASGFFRDGYKAATFNALGILSVERDKLTNLVVVGSNTEKQSFKTIAGKGSETHDLEEGRLHANTFTSSWLTSLKLLNSTKHVNGIGRKGLTMIFL